METKSAELNDAQLNRYSRQILLPEIDYEGQKKLCQAHVVIIGLGGLGSPAALYLGSAGVEQLTLVDFDEVDDSNLQRQIIHNEQRIGINKALSAAQTLRALNPNLNITTLTHKPDSAQLLSLAQQADVVVDCSDNFATRYALNQACYESATPLVSGAAIRWEGQITTYDFRRADAACYQCLYKPQQHDDQSCSRNGVVSPIVGVIGSLQALEVIKLLTGHSTLAGKLMLIDGLSMQIRQFNLNKDQHCEVCT